MGYIIDTDKQYIANTYARFPVELVSGKGAVVVDSEGKEYIDLGSGIAVNSFGYADDEWIKVQFTDKKKKQVTKLLRIEHIDEVEILEAEG